ncbi:hypothetical protein AALP_AA3G319700 [Arabis alpina]|uniref:HSF-type DNA-binding domain-containing protein n=1 Tax=Arabis alpina TaxID=50452 RepID=A0A087HD18_ARAAL|nr:hypothetical protein AALP_AA3G319700 [Arabis alpina]
MVNNKYPAGLMGFYKNVYEEVDDPSSDSIISWSPRSNRTFIIWDRKAFADFRACRFTKSFTVLKLLGFKRVGRCGGPHMEFGNWDFVRGKPERLLKMQHKAKRSRAKRAKADELFRCADRFQTLTI